MLSGCKTFTHQKAIIVVTSLKIVKTATLNDNVVTEDEKIDSVVLEVSGINLEEESYSRGLRGLREKQMDFSLNEYLARPRQVYTGPLAAQDLHVFNAWYALPAITDVLKRYSLFRGNPKIIVSFTGSNYLMGKARLYAYPERPTGNYEYGVVAPTLGASVANLTYCMTSQLPHIDMDVSEAKTIELNLPFPSPRQYITTSENDWQIHFGIINPFLSAKGGTPDIPTFQVFVSYHDVELNDIIEQAEYSSVKGSDVLSYAAAIAAKLPFVYATPISKMLSLGSAVAKFAGYSRPPLESETNGVVRHFMNPSLMSGQPNMAYGLMTDPGVQRAIGTDVIPLDNEGDTKLTSICSRWGEVMVGWTPGTPISVTPSLVSQIGANAIYPTPLSFIGLCFERWAGELEVCVQVMSSPLVRWRIGIAIIPPNRTIPASFPAEGEYKTYILETAGTTCIDITVPYLYALPFEPVYMIPTSVTAPVSTTRIVYYSLTDPVGPAATPVIPPVNLWIRGPNVQLGIPSLRELDGYTIYPQSGLESLSVFGELIEDVNYMTRRISYLAIVEESNVTGDDHLNYPVCPPVPMDRLGAGDLAYFGVNWTFATYLPTAFLGCTGGYTYLLDAVDKTATGYVDTTFDNTGHISGGPTWLAEYQHSDRGFVPFDQRISPVMEVRFPDRNVNMFRQTTSHHINGTPELVEVFTIHHVNPLAVQRWRLAVGGSDDFRMGGFLAAHPLFLRVAPY